MKIALVQLNPVIGDFQANCKKILEASVRAKELGCSLAVFPEMAISGYPPQDLLERRSFLQAHDRALAELVPQLPDLDVMLGCIEQRDGERGMPLFNSLVVARDGEVVFRAQKRLLPSYDVFDESRYFEPGPPAELYRLNGHVFGVTICEDIWYEEVHKYEEEPVEDIFRQAKSRSVKVDAVINISASPFQRDKEQVRKSIFRQICCRYRVPFLYCNQVGGQDSLLFDGRSLVMDGSGQVVAQADGFVEDLIVVDTDTWQGDVHGPDYLSWQERVYDALVMGVTDYVKKCGFRSVVLGLSGGIDSALTAAIAVDALGPNQVLGVALPSPYNSPSSLEDARQLAKNLGCHFQVLPIGELFQVFLQNLEPLFAGTDEGLAEQNIQARIRGNLLMALSNKFGHLLLTTGNKSEMAVGYCTLYGDMSGGLAVISDVPKQMVYGLSEYVNRQGERIPKRIIEKAPSAELKPDQKDQDDLPPYDILDQILEFHLEQGDGLQELVARGFDQVVVADILRRVRLNEYKRKQAPLGLKVTSKAFGSGRRFPNVQNYRE